MAMSNSAAPRLSKWPFLTGDILLVAAAVSILHFSRHPLGPWQVGALAFCVPFGAWLLVLPFPKGYHAEIKLGGSANLVDSINQINRIEFVAAQMASATSQWQSVQEGAARTSLTAREITDRMTVEGREFRAFMER